MPSDSINASLHGGRRANAGRKSSGKQTVVVRVDEALLPAIEQLKAGIDICNTNQDELIECRNRIATLEKMLQESKESSKARIKTLETTNKALSTKLTNTAEQLKTHQRLLERAETQLRKYEPKWN